MSYRQSQMHHKTQISHAHLHSHTKKVTLIFILARTYLQVDLLPEIAQSPRVLTDYMAALTERGIRPRVDSYITSKQPQDLPSLLPSALIIPATAGSATSTYNLPLITSLVVRTITCTYLQ